MVAVESLVSLVIALWAPPGGRGYLEFLVIQVGRDHLGLMEYLELLVSTEQKDLAEER